MSSNARACAPTLFATLSTKFILNTVSVNGMYM